MCGPHPPVKATLGPHYVTTWDPKGADFAMMLGEFYCAKLDAPVLVDVVRDGVSYARVYDIRGRSFTTLLTMPGSTKIRLQACAHKVRSMSASIRRRPIYCAAA